MDYEIRRLTPELAEDYFDFFDNRAFSDGSPFYPCYCNAFNMSKDRIEAEFNRKAEEYGGGKESWKRALRESAERMVAAGEIQGYLAYDQGKAIGWCNANERMSYYRTGEFDLGNVPEDEAYWSVRTKYRMRQVRELWETVRYERLFYRGYQLGPMNRAIDITGDESIMMVSLPGHTDGHAGIIIKNGEKYILLAADAAISPRNWEEMKAAGLGAEKGLQLKTLRWIAKTAEDPDCVKVLCSHDPNVGNGATYEL